jgi:hypothetical protein
MAKGDKFMPTYIVPKSDQQRRSQLQKAAAQAQRDQTEGSTILTTERTAALVALAQSFAQLLDARLTAEQLVAVRRQAFVTAVTVMKGELRQAWTAVRANVATGVWSPAAAGFYTIPTSGSADYPNTRKEWLEAGLNTLNVDTLAVAQSMGGLLTRSQLQAACDTAVAALHALETAKEDKVEARQAVIAQRQTCDNMLKLVVGDLRNSTRLLSPVEMRRLVRTYGGQFRYRQNEPAEGEEETAELPLAG